MGIGGIPFLFPVLYQVGLGFTPIQSGLLMIPQAVAAMSLKLTMPAILRRLGYRRVLISNTLILGLLIVLFATIGVGTPVWLKLGGAKLGRSATGNLKNGGLEPNFDHQML